MLLSTMYFSLAWFLQALFLIIAMGRIAAHGILNWASNEGDLPSYATASLQARVGCGSYGRNASASLRSFKFLLGNISF